MDRERLAELLDAVRRGACPVDEALERLRALPYEDLGFARIDHHRGLRNGFPEVVFGQGKTPEQIVAIAERLVAAGGNVLVTRLAPEAASHLVSAVVGFEYHALPRLAVRRTRPVEPAGTGTVLVVTAGTADLPVAEEAAISAELMGSDVERLYDVGVSGLHRLLAERQRLWNAAVLIVVAGMEGALPSVVGGLVDRPVIAVPTSVGYGTSMHGLAALLAMLNTCAAGVTVVNIDNGFGAAAAATRINQRPPLMAEITAGRARRILSVGGLTTSVGGSYLWQALKRPFQSSSRQEAALLETHIRNARRMVERSQELRGAFMKMAQLLSMRQDLFPAEALEVLAVVQSAVPPMPWAKVRRVLVSELGRPPEECFASIEHEAFAAASLGQVHRATVRGGKPVVVKVQYPGVADTVHQDLKNIRALVRVFDSIAHDVMRQDVDSKDVVRELEERLAEELDYGREAANLERFRKLLAADDDVLIPRAYPKLSARRVLTMDRLDGYPLQDIMAPGVDQELKDWVALKLFHLLWRQVFTFGVLHADPHPGNYLVTHHPKIGILDFGSVRVFEPEVRRGYLRTARGLLAGDGAAVGAAVTALGFVHPDQDAAPFIEMLHIVCEPILVDREYDPRDYDIVERGLRISQIKLSNRLYRAPGHQVFFLRALAGLDGYLKAFGTVRNWHRLFRAILDAVPDDGGNTP